jgi:hypothetical protein
MSSLRPEPNLGATGPTSSSEKEPGGCVVAAAAVKDENTGADSDGEVDAHFRQPVCKGTDREDLEVDGGHNTDDSSSCSSGPPNSPWFGDVNLNDCVDMPPVCVDNYEWWLQRAEDDRKRSAEVLEARKRQRLSE